MRNSDIRYAIRVPRKQGDLGLHTYQVINRCKQACRRELEVALPVTQEPYGFTFIPARLPRGQWRKARVFPGVVTNYLGVLSVPARVVITRSGWPLLFINGAYVAWYEQREALILKLTHEALGIQGLLGLASFRKDPALKQAYERELYAQRMRICGSVC